MLRKEQRIKITLEISYYGYVEISIVLMKNVKTVGFKIVTQYNAIIKGFKILSSLKA
jgi:hypothetical protein